MEHLGNLLCGHRDSEGIAKIALEQLRSSIDKFGGKATIFLGEGNSEEMLTFGPFCARVLLENSCAALVGRLDSFRMLYLSAFQAQPEYEPGKRARSAFSWTGDVVPEEKAQTALWNLEHDVPKISRALFSKYLEHIYWKPAIEGLLDFASRSPSTPELSEVLLMDADHYISQSKGRGIQLYSTLSKGVHWEFFTSALIFDDVTVKTAIRETLLLVAQLGLISHFIPTAYCSLSKGVAIQEYTNFRKLLP